MYRPVEHFEGGVRIDPRANAELERWVRRHPRQDLEPLPSPPVAMAAPDCDPDPYDMRREQGERLSLNEEQGEVGYQ